MGIGTESTNALQRVNNGYFKDLMFITFLWVVHDRIRTFVKIYWRNIKTDRIFEHDHLVIAIMHDPRSPLCSTQKTKQPHQVRPKKPPNSIHSNRPSRNRHPTRWTWRHRTTKFLQVLFVHQRSQNRRSTGVMDHIHNHCCVDFACVEFRRRHLDLCRRQLGGSQDFLVVQAAKTHYAEHGNSWRRTYAWKSGFWKKKKTNKWK